MSARRLRFLLAAVAVVTVAHALYFYGWIIDDAYISFRYARNLARGLGLVWNAGERVEGYTNFLWVLACAAGERLGISARTSAPILGLTSAAALATVAAAMTWRAAGRGPGRLAGAALAGAVVAASSDVAFYAATGLETVAFALAVLGALFAATERRPLLFASAGVCAVLLRPEGVVVCAVGLVVLGRAWWRAAIVLGAAAVAYVAFKWTYFGAVLPNTAVVKAEPGAQGLRYLVHHLPEWGWIFAPALLAFPLRGARWPGLLVLASLAALTLETWDWMPLGRLLLPVLGPVAVSIGVLLAFLVRRQARVGLGLVALAMVGFAVTTVRDGAKVAERNAVMKKTDAARAHVFQELAKHYRSAATFDIGLLGYEAPDMTIIDLGGLTDREIARAPGGYFDKRAPVAYLQKRSPDLFLFTTNAPPRIDMKRGTFTLDALYPSEDHVKRMPWFQRSYDYLGTERVHETVCINAFVRRADR